MPKQGGPEVRSGQGIAGKGKAEAEQGKTGSEDLSVVK